MSAYLVTSPYGPNRFHKWECDNCSDYGGGLGAERDEVRAAASAHVESTGHTVDVFDGTREGLYALATTAEAAEAGI